MANVAKHKDNLVRTAMRLFRQQGFASTGLQQIVTESGAPRGSLYHYFPSGKEALGAAVVDLAGRLMAEMLTDVAARSPNPQSFLRGYCRVMAGWMKESGFRSGCPIATTLLENAPQSPPITAAGRRAVDHWIRIIARVLINGNVPPRAARAHAQSIIAAMEGALILARIRRSTAPILAVAELPYLRPAVAPFAAASRRVAGSRAPRRASRRAAAARR
jgi:TetR/AcrR family transcriptional repressor of lmrAB and yxaGH operons